MVATPKAGVPCSGYEVESGRMKLILGLSLLLLVGCLGSYNRPIQPISFGGEVPYPEAARLQKIEGFVIVRYDVTVEGIVHNVRVAEAVPPGVFDEAAIATVRGWKYKAPILDGVPQPVRDMESRVAFELGNTEQYDDL